MNAPYTVDRVSTVIHGSSDSLFVACSSFEQRAIGAVSKLSKKYQASRALICYSIEYANKGRAKSILRTLQENLAESCRQRPELLSFAIEEPIRFVKDLDKKFLKLGLERNSGPITVDISTFPRQELLLLLNYLRHRAHGRTIRLLYSDVERYATELHRGENAWLTRGVRSVNAVPGFCGVQYPQLSKLLVIILGHEGERTHITLRRHQPDKVIFLSTGESRFRPGLKNICDQQNTRMIEEYGDQCFWPNLLPSHGIAETEAELRAIFNKFRYSHNVFVAPNGTKLQLVGTFLASRIFVELQIVYAVPVLYNWQKYSSGVGHLWEYVLEAGATHNGS